MHKKLWLLTILISFPAFGLELQTKPREIFKKDFNVIPRVLPQENFSFNLEVSQSSNPLVAKGSLSKNKTPLATSLQEISLGAAYGFNSFEIGVNAPLQKVSGVPDSSFFLGSSQLAIKYSFMKFLAIEGNYFLPSSKKITASYLGSDMIIPMGYEKGAMGLKLVGQYGELKSSGVILGYLGYLSAPDNKFETLDQTSVLQFGIGGLLPISENINFGLEFYGERTPTNMPLSAQGVVNYKTQSINYQLGVGTGSLQGAGSNEVKMFLGLSFGLDFSSSNRKYQSITPAKSPNYNNIKKDEINYDNEDIQTPNVLDPDKAKKPILEE